VATYLTAPLPLAPTLALRAGGQRVWGTFPFHDAAFLGGASTLRGWGEQRFAGHAAAFGNAELRIFLAKFFLLVPGDLGLFGLADAGRVFASDDRSSEWHTGFGGGVWIAPLTRSNTLSVGVARGAERTGVYVRSGFLF
jgi:hemolysin activation/secretion protein